MSKLRRTITVHDTNRDFVLSIFDDYDQHTADETIEKAKKLTPDEIFQKTKWVINKKEPDPALNIVFWYPHGVMNIDNIMIIVSMIDRKGRI